MIVGARVRWRHQKDDGTGRAMDFEGTVLAVERGGTPATWSALVAHDDLTLSAADIKDLQIVAEEAKPDQKEMIAAADSLLFLEQYLEVNFAGTKGTTTTPVEWAGQLLDQLKSELLGLGAERDSLRAANESLAQDLKMSKKKPKGPAGPGEEVA